METSTWKAYCQAIIGMNGKLLLDNPVYPEMEFKCNLCGMTWTCLTNLDGKKHAALQNKCGGMWVKT